MGHSTMPITQQKKKKMEKKKDFRILNIFVAMGKKHKFWTLDALTSNK
jgi:hypothetical protein